MNPQQQWSARNGSYLIETTSDSSLYLQRQQPTEYHPYKAKHTQAQQNLQITKPIKASNCSTSATNPQPQTL